LKFLPNSTPGFSTTCVSAARLIAGATVLTLLAGCETLSYYGQSVGGQLEVLAKRKPIDELIDDEATEPRLRARLESVLRMRRFAVAELGLPDNTSYTSYADLKRNHVVWNVFAAPEFSVTPTSWCFPVVGCVVYRGYFKQESAKKYAQKLEADGVDTYVGGINAYSTLGWFNDPVLNTFLGYSEPRLAGLLFHEITHQKIYVKGDSVFNESLASAVELEGVKRWLEASNSSAEADVVRRQLERSDEITALLLETREALGYDRWFSQDFNNAYLVSAAAYRSRLPAFEALIAESGGDMEVFWEAAERLSKLPREQRDAELDRLTAAHAGS